MNGKLVSSLTFAISLLFGAAVVFPTEAPADERGNPSGCAKIKNIDEKKECHKKALEELKERDKDRDKDKDDDKKKKKKDKKKKKEKKGKK